MYYKTYFVYKNTMVGRSIINIDEAITTLLTELHWYKRIFHKGATIQFPMGRGGWSIFKINILGRNFNEINNCLKNM